MCSSDILQEVYDSLQKEIRLIQSVKEVRSVKVDRSGFKNPSEDKTRRQSARDPEQGLRAGPSFRHNGE